MGFHSYSFGTCDLCKKEIDSRQLEGFNNQGYEFFYLPSLVLFPSKLPSSYRLNKKVQRKRYDLCDECTLKIAKLLYDTYGWYYEEENEQL